MQSFRPSIHNHGSSQKSSAAASPTYTTATGTMSAGGISFAKGQVMRGEIVDLRDKDIKIRVQEQGKPSAEHTVTARLDTHTDLSIGDRASFLVTSADAKSISLKLLPEQRPAAQDGMVQKALAEAGLPNTARNAAAVQSLLANQLSINRTSIHQLLMQAATFKNASIETLALMTKYRIPMTEVNTAQFEAYRNYEHRIVQQLDTLSNSVLSLLTSGKETQAAALHDTLLSFLTTPSAPASAAGQTINGNAAGQTVNGGITGQAVNGNTTGQLDDAPIFLSDSLSQLMTNEERLSLVDTLEPYGLSSEVRGLLLNQDLNAFEPANLRLLADAIHHAMQTALDAQAATDTPTAADTQATADTQAIVGAQTPADAALSPDTNALLQALQRSGSESLVQQFSTPTIQNLLQQFQQSALAEQTVGAQLDAPAREQLLAALPPALSDATRAAVADGSLPIPTLLQAVSESLTYEQAPPLLASDAYKQLLKSTLLKHWTLTPKQLTEENALPDYYARLDAELSQLLSQAERQSQGTGRENAAQVLSQAENLRENIDFMKTLNDLFTYVQLPLQLSEKQAHGELYVYTKKDALLRDRHNIRVLLHLDMEQLGPLDIHVELTGRNVVSRFYVEDHTSLPLLSEQLPQLEKALAHKGFTCKSELNEREKPVDLVKDFIAPENGSHAMKRYTFDIRA